MVRVVFHSFVVLLQSGANHPVLRRLEIERFFYTARDSVEASRVVILVVRVHPVEVVVGLMGSGELDFVGTHVKGCL